MAYGINIESFPSIYNDVVDGIPESYIHYYKQYLYEIEDQRLSSNINVSPAPFDAFSEAEIIQLKFNFNFKD